MAQLGPQRREMTRLVETLKAAMKLQWRSQGKMSSDCISMGIVNIMNSCMELGILWRLFTDDKVLVKPKRLTVEENGFHLFFHEPKEPCVECFRLFSPVRMIGGCENALPTFSTTDKLTGFSNEIACSRGNWWPVSAWHCVTTTSHRNKKKIM